MVGRTLRLASTLELFRLAPRATSEYPLHYPGPDRESHRVWIKKIGNVYPELKLFFSAAKLPYLIQSRSHLRIQAERLVSSTWKEPVMSVSPIVKSTLQAVVINAGSNVLAQGIKAYRADVSMMVVAAGASHVLNLS